MTNFIQTYSYFLLKINNSVLIKARVILFVSYYYEDLFQEKSLLPLFHEYIRFLISQLNKEEVLIIQSLDALGFIFETNGSVYDAISPLINEFFGRLCDFITTIQFPIFFEILQNILIIYKETLPQYEKEIINCGQQLTLRITQEFKENKSLKQCGNIFINMSWNILRCFGDNPQYLSRHMDQLELTMIPLYELFENFIDIIDFDEDICLFVAECIKQRKSINEAERKLVVQFPAVLAKNEYLFGNLFGVVNLFIVMDNKAMQENHQYLQQVTFCNFIDMGIQAMLTTGSNIDEICNSQGAVILQLIIQFISTIVMSLQNRITQRYLQKPSQDQTRQSKRLIQKLGLFIFFNNQQRLFGIYFCGFFCNFLLTQKILINIFSNETVLILMCQDETIYNHNYEIKVFVLGVCELLKFILQQTPNAQQIDLFRFLITKLIQLLQKEESIHYKLDITEEFKTNQQYGSHLDQNPKKNIVIEKNEVKCPKQSAGIIEDFSEEESFHEDSSEMSNEKDNAPEFKEENICLDILVTMLNNIDQFDYFKKMMQHLKSQYPVLLKEIIDGLDSKLQNQLKEILVTQMIQIGNKPENQNNAITRQIIKPTTRRKPQV